MSLIGHKCTVCGHPDIYHGHNKQCCYTHCQAGPHDPVWDESVVLPTWSCETGELVESIPEPGTKFGGFGLVPLDLCGCEQCRELWLSLTTSRV